MFLITDIKYEVKSDEEIVEPKVTKSRGRKPRGRPRFNPKAESKSKVEPKKPKVEPKKPKVEPEEADASRDFIRRPRRAFPGQKHHCHNDGCDRVFKHRGSLNRHLLWECQVEPAFRCAYCTFKAFYAVNVNKHCKNAHNRKSSKGLYRQNGVWVQIDLDTFSLRDLQG